MHRTPLESVYPYVQEKYGRARYGNFDGETGIKILRPGKSPVFISNETFDKHVALNPDWKLEDLVSSLIDYDDAELDRAFEKLLENNPTGIFNPADYMGKTVIEKDTDDDGDFDERITKEPSRQEE